MNSRLRGLISVTVGFFLFNTPVLAQPTFRNLTGTVQDQHHEPLTGAIVEIENEDTKSVISYITDRTGWYSFKRLEGEADYRIWFTYRGQRSKIRQLSQFDGHHDATINLMIKEY